MSPHVELPVVQLKHSLRCGKPQWHNAAMQQPHVMSLGSQGHGHVKEPLVRAPEPQSAPPEPSPRHDALRAPPVMFVLTNAVGPRKLTTGHPPSLTDMTGNAVALSAGTSVAPLFAGHAVTAPPGPEACAARASRWKTRPSGAGLLGSGVGAAVGAPGVGAERGGRRHPLRQLRALQPSC
jgi:hypothetical protein